MALEEINYVAEPRGALKQASDLWADRPGEVALAALALTIFGGISFATRRKKLGRGMLLSSAALVLPIFLVNRAVVTRPSRGEERAFIEGKSGYVEIEYVGEVPVVRVKEGDSRARGKAQGYALAPNIHQLWKRYMNFLALGARSLRARRKVLSSARSMRIPDRFREEMEGLAEGYNQWLEESGMTHSLKVPSRKLTVDDLLVMHTFNNGLKGFALCTAIGTERGLARTLDWESGGVLGPNTCLIYREGQRKSVTVGFAGELDSLTGMNDRGLCIAINEAGLVAGLAGKTPYGFLMREVLEECDTVEQALDHIKQHPPASSCIITLVDKAMTRSLHCHTPEGELIEIPPTTPGLYAAGNHHRNLKGETIPETMVSRTSQDRYDAVAAAAERLLDPHQDYWEVSNEVLKEANMKRSVHKVGLDPHTGDIRLAYDNYDAALLDWHLLPWDQICGI